MESIQGFLKDWDVLLTLPLVTIMGASLMFTIDNFNMKDVERKFLSNSKYFSIFIPLVIINTISLSVMTSLIIGGYSSFDNMLDQVMKNAPNALFGSFTLLLFFYLVLAVVNFKVDYFIELKVGSNTEKWYLVRRKGEKMLLIDDKQHFRYLSISKVMEEVIYSEYIAKGIWVMNIYNFIYNKKGILLFSLYGVAIAIYATLINEINKNGNISNWIIPLFLFVFLLIILTYLIASTMKSVKDMTEKT